MTGTVTDASGAVIAGAGVVCRNSQTGLAYNATTSPDGLFRSADGGLTWEALNTQRGSEALALTLDPRHPATLFAWLADGTLLRSDDSGVTWATVEASP